MAKVPLIGGAYTAKSIIANAQRCVNLYPERNSEDSPFPITHYPTPGLDLLATAPISAAGRCLYRASNGNLYAVVGANVYAVSNQWVYTLLGSIDIGSTPVYMADNSLVIVIVDGTANGYCIDITDPGNAFAQIIDPSFLGGTRADVVDTFLLFNQPGTLQWYCSLSNVTFEMLTTLPGTILTGDILTPGSAYTNGSFTGVAMTGGSGTGAIATITVSGNAVIAVNLTNPGINYEQGDNLSAALAGGTGFVYTVNTVSAEAFDPLYIASKDGYPDPIQTLIVMHREIWLIGQLTSEIWYDAGNADFPFAILPGTFIEHGTIAPYSIAKQDLIVYWLSQDEQGQAIVIKGQGYQAKRISTSAIEQEISKYATISDAIGYTYQQEGHAFYVLNFPSANKTWVWDEAQVLWHERAWLDSNGNLNRHRSNCAANAYGKNVVADWETGALYAYDLNTYTDNGAPITRIRGFPHLVDNANKVTYARFIADMETGTDTGVVDGSTSASPPTVSLRWSDTKGQIWGNRVDRSMGAGGQYLTNIQWRRLGIARDRVFELSWSAPTKTALNGAYVELTPSGA